MYVCSGLVDSKTGGTNGVQARVLGGTNGVQKMR